MTSCLERERKPELTAWSAALKQIADRRWPEPTISAHHVALLAATTPGCRCRGRRRLPPHKTLTSEAAKSPKESERTTKSQVSWK
jgi:hypothetical protein